MGGGKRPREFHQTPSDSIQTDAIRCLMHTRDTPETYARHICAESCPKLGGKTHTMSRIATCPWRCRQMYHKTCMNAYSNDYANRVM